MRIYSENLSLEQFKPWAGAVETVNTIIENSKSQEFEQLIEELYPDGLTDTNLNDLLWHDTSWVYEQLGIEEV